MDCEEKFNAIQSGGKVYQTYYTLNTTIKYIVISTEFSNLPDTVLEHIFEYLPRNEMLNATLVCQRFNIIFGGNLKNFKLVLNFENLNPGGVPKLSRLYRKIKVKMLTITDDDNQNGSYLGDNILDMFIAIGSKMRHLELVHCVLNDKFLVNTLKTMPLLETLVFTGTEINSFESIEYMSLDLPFFLNLKEICISAQSCDVVLPVLARAEKIRKFSFLYRTKINKLPFMDIHFDSNENYDDGSEVDHLNFQQYSGSQYESIKTFLGRQRNLKSLNVDDGKFFDVPFIDYTFQLECIELCCYCMTSSQVDIMFEFLRHHSNLKKVLLDCDLDPFDSRSTINFKYFDHIMHLESMRIFQVVLNSELNPPVNHLSICDYFRDCQIVNPNLEDLYFAMEPPNKYFKLNEYIVRIFPNIKRLQIILFENWLLSSRFETSILRPLNQLSHLKSIVLIEIDISYYDILFSLSLFKNVETFQVTRSNTFDWKIFKIYYSQFEELVIKLAMKRSDEAGIIFVENVIEKLQEIRSITSCILDEKLRKEITQMIV